MRAKWSPMKGLFLLKYVSALSFKVCATVLTNLWPCSALVVMERSFYRRSACSWSYSLFQWVSCHSLLTSLFESSDSLTWTFAWQTSAAQSSGSNALLSSLLSCTWRLFTLTTVSLFDLTKSLLLLCYRSFANPNTRQFDNPTPNAQYVRLYYESSLLHPLRSKSANALFVSLLQYSESV